MPIKGNKKSASFRTYHVQLSPLSQNNRGPERMLFFWLRSKGHCVESVFVIAWHCGLKWTPKTSTNALRTVWEQKIWNFQLCKMVPLYWSRISDLSSFATVPVSYFYISDKYYTKYFLRLRSSLLLRLFNLCTLIDIDWISFLKNYMCALHVCDILNLDVCTELKIIKTHIQSKCMVRKVKKYNFFGVNTEISSKEKCTYSLRIQSRRGWFVKGYPHAWSVLTPCSGVLEIL